MLSYKLSMDFIRNYIVKTAEADKYKVLDKLMPRTLSALAKGLYIYELEE